MATQSDIGFSATVTGTTLAAIFTGFLRDITIDGFGERSAVDSSHMTVANGWRTFIPGDLKNPGSATLDVLFDVGQLANYKTIVNSTKESWIFTLPTQGTTSPNITCQGFATSASVAVPMDDMMAATVTVKFTGEPTMTNATTV